MTLAIGPLEAPPVEALDVEIVERKGRGHPDSICDALAEAFSLALSRFYRERFGLILHHNVDKALLWGGVAEARYGGGRVVKPFEVFVAGRATARFEGLEVPVAALFEDSARAWLGANLHALDPERQVVLHSLVRPGSADLVALFLRQARSGRWLANDTSIGVGHAPLSPLEALVLAIERDLTDSTASHPEIGEDVKLMAVRQGGRLDLTLGCALVAGHVDSRAAYREAKARITERVGVSAAEAGFEKAAITVNAADDIAADSVYLTVTGTSAEAGDDGAAGRGNRANGLIAPYRPMTLESVAGKNPVSHVGKLYNLAAGLIAEALVAEIEEVGEAQCWMVSRIGHPIDQPQAVDVKLRTNEGVPVATLAAPVREVVERHLAGLPDLGRELLGGRLAFDRWPLAAPDPWAAERAAMVREVAAEARETAGYTGRAAFKPAVMWALASVPRHEFVPAAERAMAYYNGALPISHGQTISQPYVVALMTDLLDVGRGDTVLEVGTGSGYQAAVLARVVGRVLSLEIVESLAEAARERLARLGYDNVTVRAGDGAEGWPEHAPYDGIIVTAGTAEVPPALIAQLAPGGKLVIPLNRGLMGQELTVIEKAADGSVDRRSVLPVAFVPLTHRRRPRPGRG